MTTSNGRKKRSITMILMAPALLLVCGGGFLLIDYYSGSSSSTFLEHDESGLLLHVTGRIRGLGGRGTRVSEKDDNGVVTVTLDDLEFTVTQDAVKLEDNVLVTIPENVVGVEVEAYHGSYRVITDDGSVTSITIASDK